ncbi:MAG: ATP-binding protein, partial [Aquabacterium sp.]
FIGRRLERADALALLDEPDVRLLTLLGPGGVGKSRLAQVLMADARGRRFGPRCHFLALEDLTALPAVVGRLALQLGVGVPDPAQAATQLARGLGTGPALLVLDNAEHLAEVIRPLLTALLDAAPGLALLATSRVRLHLPQERVVPLPGLAVPEADSRDLDAAQAYDGVQLFAWHATAARHDFRMERELPAVLDILDAVGGLPLAIELAAGWTRLLPTAAIAADLKRSLDLLQREPGHADAAARAEHASVGRVLEQTWALLSPAERAALEALSAFQGGCSRDAARDVADCPLALAAALADKSLLATDELGRFQLHPLVAAFAGQQLDADAPRAAAVRDRHAQHYSRLAAALAPHAVGDTRLLAAGIEAEFANLQVAWRHAMAHRRADRLAAMTRALWAWYEARNRQAEGVAIMQPALACIDDGAPDAAWARARLAHGVSMLLHRSGRNAEAQALARAAIEPSADAGDTEAHVGCILNTGSCLLADGQADAALQLFQRAEAVASQRGHRQCQAWARGNAAVALQLLSRLDESRSVFQQALLGSREVGDQYNVGVHLVNLGNLELDAARWDDALRWLEAARAHARQHGLQVLAVYAQTNLANLQRQQGDLAAARVHFSDAVEMCRRSGTYLVEWGARLGVARIDIAEGHLAPALRSIQAVVREAMALGSNGDVLLACAVYSDWLAAGGDMAAAAGCWRMVLDGRLLSQRRRDQIEARIREAGPAVQVLPAASLGEVLVRLQGQD